MTKSNNFLKNSIIYFIFLIFFIVGITIFKDFGISVDEEFQRFSGFFWLNYALDFTPFKSFQEDVITRLSKIEGFTLPDPKDFPFYGVIFDLPLAFLETIFNIQNEKNYFLLRHFLNFIVFFIGSLLFYKLLNNRFKDQKIIIIGLLLYISSPRIFGDSFFNNKDIIFLSLVTIVFYYKFKLIDHFNYTNIIYFAFFSGLACSLRIVAIFIPFSFLVLILFSILNRRNVLFYLKRTFIFLLIFLMSLYLFWPYLWESPIKNLLYAVKIFSKYSLEIKMLFNGNYISSNFLPLSYLPTWILITTPLIVIALFFIGFIFFLKKFFLRTVNIKENSIYEDFWRGKNEKKDFYVFFNFILIFIYLVLSNAVLYTGWRQVYFLHFFLIYISAFGIYILTLKTIKKKLLLSILVFLILNNFAQIIKLHPYQSLYFNRLVGGENKSKFEIDYWGISGLNFIKEILYREKNSRKIKIAVASHLPLERSLKMLKEKEQNLISIIGQNYQDADYIFNNNISEVNKFFNKKYDIPKNFEKVYQFNLDGFVIYEMYKKQ